MKLTLQCSLAQYDALWAAFHATRRSSKTVTVDKAALGALLRDHAKLHDAATPRATIVGAYPPATLAAAGAR
jgi:hypothetical protein